MWKKPGDEEDEALREKEENGRKTRERKKKKSRSDEDVEAVLFGYIFEQFAGTVYLVCFAHVTNEIRENRSKMKVRCGFDRPMIRSNFFRRKTKMKSAKWQSSANRHRFSVGLSNDAARNFSFFSSSCRCACGFSFHGGTSMMTKKKKKKNNIAESASFSSLRCRTRLQLGFAVVAETTRWKRAGEKEENRPTREMSTNFFSSSPPPSLVDLCVPIDSTEIFLSRLKVSSTHHSLSIEANFPRGRKSSVFLSVCVCENEFICMYIIGTLCYQNNKGNSDEKKEKEKEREKWNVGEAHSHEFICNTRTVVKEEKKCRERERRNSLTRSLVFFFEISSKLTRSSIRSFVRSFFKPLSRTVNRAEREKKSTQTDRERVVFLKFMSFGKMKKRIDVWRKSEKERQRRSEDYDWVSTQRH